MGLVYTLTLKARVEDLGTLKDRFKDPGLVLGWETGAPLILRNRVVDLRTL